MHIVPLEVEILIKDDSAGNLVNDKIENYCDINNIRYINVIDVLRTSENKTDIYMDDCHLAVYGNNIVANELTKFILKFGY